MRPVLLLGAGAVGAAARYLLDGWVVRRVGTALPWGTLAVNVAGSFLLGLLTGLGRAGVLGPLALATAGSGFCGSFTTFSTWSYETVRLVDEGAFAAAALNTAANFGLGLVAAATGLGLAALAGP